MTGTQSKEQADRLYVGAKALLKTGAFNLRKFSTNSSSLQARIDTAEASRLGDPARNTEATETFLQATLSGHQGLRHGEQNVVFALDELAEEARALEPTKRNVISLIGRFYDPLGFLAPIVV